MLTPGAIYPANAGILEYSREEAVTAQISGEIIAEWHKAYSTYKRRCAYHVPVE